MKSTCRAESFSEFSNVQFSLATPFCYDPPIKNETTIEYIVFGNRTPIRLLYIITCTIDLRSEPHSLITCRLNAVLKIDGDCGIDFSEEK